MAVDYTKIFTVIGSYVDKINDYYAYNVAFDDDQGDIETLLAGQDLVRLSDGLSTTYADFGTSVTTWINALINRISKVLTDETLIGANFPFGTTSSLQLVWPALIHDMVTNGQSVDNSTVTLSPVEYDLANASAGVLVTGTLLDGVTSPVAGAPVIRDYAGVTTQMAPTEESLVFTCISDSENGSVRGSETFTITGTLASSSPFSSGGENIGQLGSIQVSDNAGGQYLRNGSFENATSSVPDNWTFDDGIHGVDYSLNSVGGLIVPTQSFETLSSSNALTMVQELNIGAFQRNKSYFLSLWAQLIATPQTLNILLQTDTADLLNVNLTPASATWTNYNYQFVIPASMTTLTLTISTPSLVGQIGLDQMVIVPCQYHAGVAVALFQGADKFLIGDQITLPIANDNDGKFQSFMRKAYKVQLPTSNSATISEALIV